MEFPYEEDVLTRIEDISGRFSYRFVLDVNGLDAQCRTALYLAVANSYYDIVKYLLEVGMICKKLLRKVFLFTCIYDVISKSLIRSFFCVLGRIPNNGRRSEMPI